MPGKVKVKVLAGRNLPVMDKGSDTTDAYVEIKLGNITHKTDVCRKSLNPQWNPSEWYRFEVDDADLQDEPLQLRLMDHDTYSANDAIGKVYISLNPLLLPEAQQHPPDATTTITHSGKGAVMSGWIPVFDTMHGIRGEVNVIVKVELFNDFNKFRQSSCGVQFFHSPIIPHGYQAQVIHGFVEELVINDDPEYQWIDKIRTPRASNEARQVAFLKLSGQVQRKIGLKALELGANAVIGFRRCLDLEGDVGVVARGIGTAVTLVRHQEYALNHSANGNLATSPDVAAQQMRKYIDFLNTANITENTNSYSHLSNEQVVDILNILSPTSSMDLRVKNKLDTSIHSSSLGTDLFTHQQRSTKEWQQYKKQSDVSHGKSMPTLKDDSIDQNPIKLLLEQEDSRHPTLQKGSLSKSLKSLKSSSQNILSKKISAMKSKRSDDDDNAERMSVKSYTSEKSIKIQFAEFKSELKKKTRFKTPILKRSTSGGEGNDMAAMLVRSVMHVHSSLDCIKETLENNSPMSTLRRPSKQPSLTESEAPEVEQSQLNLSIIIDPVPLSEELAENTSSDAPKLQSFSLENLSAHLDSSIDKGLLNVHKIKRGAESCPNTPIETGKSETFLQTPVEENIYASSNICSSDEYSSSDDEDMSEDTSMRADGSNFNLETVSLIVKSVLEQKKLKDGELSGSSNENITEPHQGSDLSPSIITGDFSFDTKSDYNSSILESETKNETDNYHLYDHDYIHTEQMSPGIISDVLISVNDSSVDNTNAMIPVHAKTADIDKVSSPVDKNLGHPYTSDVNHKHHNIFDTAFKKVLKEKLHFKGFHSHHASPTSSSSIASPTDLKKNKFHFPSNFFRRHTSETEGTSGGLFGHKGGLLSPTTKKKKLRTFSAGESDLKPGLISTAIRTILMEKVNVMGEIINHEPIVGDEQHVRKQSHCSLDASKFLPDDCDLSAFDKTTMNTSKFNETSLSYPPLTLSKSLTDISNLEASMYPNMPRKRKEMDVLSLPRETVLGALFMSLNDVKHLDEEHKLYLSMSSGFSSHSSLHRYSNNPSKTVSEDPNVADDISNVSKDHVDQMHHHHSDMNPVESEVVTDHEEEKVIIESEYKNKDESDKKLVSRVTFNESDLNIKKNDEDVISVISSKSKSDPNELAKYKQPCNRAPGAGLAAAAASVGDCNSPKHMRTESHGNRPPTTANLNINPSHRRSSDSDLSITPKGNSLTANVCGGAVLRPSMNQESIDMLEYPFLTITKFPSGFILHIGGAVAARSVKLLERVPNPEEPAPRDTWWSELRTEVRSHMRALRCNAVLAYQETTAICDDVCVLSATGTAAVIDLHPSSLLSQNSGPPSASKVAPTVNNKINEDQQQPHAELHQTSSLDRTDFEKTEQNNNPKQNTENNFRRRGGAGERCGPCHIPYNSSSMPYRVSVTKCAICKKGRVPSVVLCSVEPPEGLGIVGRGCLLQAAITRARTPARGEPAARDISDQLPFLEYELHRLLLAKLRVRGMNAIFGLRTSIAVGGNLVAAVGVGTGVLLAALGPAAGGPRVRAGPGDPQLLQALQQGLDDALQANKNVYQLHTEQEPNGKAVIASDTEDSEDELPEMDLGAGNKDTCVLEVDDAEDLEVLRVLTEARPPSGLHVVNTQSVPGLLGCEGLVSVRNLQMFTQLWRARLASPPGPLHQHFHRLLQNVYFKLRRMVPCAICDLRFRLDLPEADEIQLVVTGMAVGLGEPPPEAKKLTDTPNILDAKTKDATNGGELKRTVSNDMIFTLEEEHVTDINGPQKPTPAVIPIPMNGTYSASTGNTAWQSGVDMTPLAGVPGARVLRYLGNLDYIFVRESTSIREHGGISGFLHGFITEVMAVIRAHVTALGGNAIVAFYMTELILSDNPHKNQAQCLVSVGGDVVFVTYFSAEV